MEANIKWTAGSMAVALCAALAGCGGGGGSSGAAGPTAPTTNKFDLSVAGGPFTANLGDSVQIPGSASTAARLIKAMSWTAIANDASSPALILGNSDCASAIKNDVKFASNGQTSTGTSQWTCALAVAAPAKLSKTATYQIALSVTDDASNTQTVSTSVTYAVSGNLAGGASAVTANPGQGYFVASGSNAPLNCQASGGTAPYSYQWSVKANGGFPISLSSYATAASSFSAPSVVAVTNVALACMATDANGIASAAAPINIVINPPVTPTVTGGGPSVLAVGVGSNFVIAPLGNAPLSCQATGGKAPYSYIWTVTSNAGLPLSLTSYSSALSSFVGPMVSAATNIGLRCLASDADGSTASANLTVTVAPTGTVPAGTVPPLTSSGPSLLAVGVGGNFTVAPSVNAPLSCQATGGKAPYTYIWTVISNAGLPLSLTSYSSALSSFVGPVVSAATNIDLRCQAADAEGSTAGANLTVTVAPGAVPPLTGNAGLGFTTTPGTSNPLHCSASGGVAPYSYQWTVSTNAGLNVPLSSYGSADTNFTAPAVSALTNLAFKCVVTDSSQNSSTSTVSVTDVSPVTTNSLVANAGKGLNVNPGQTVALDGSATGWFTGTGAPTSAGAISYQWSTTTAGVIINNRNLAMTTFVAPTSILTATTIPFTLTATSGGVSSSASVNFLVDPFAPFTLKVNPSAQAFVMANGASVSIAANGSTNNGTPTLYYQWTQTSGTAVTLGGQQTSTLGFVPTVAGVYTFRVAVGYQPISASYVGVYFADATVTAQ